MDKLLSILFSVVLFMATSPPRTSGGECAGMVNCSKETTEHLPCRAPGGENSGNKDACPAPVCCVCGPCCCLCLIPEPPVLLSPAAVSEEEFVKPVCCQVFIPQQSGNAIWKPPASSV